MRSKEDQPAFLFLGDDLVRIMVHWWQLGRIEAELLNLSDKRIDPMESEDGMQEVAQEAADFLMKLERRDDETTKFEEGWIVCGKENDEHAA
jgi:hypothetical protein